jgi:nitrogen fixation protein NifU and related proteins
MSDTRSELLRNLGYSDKAIRFIEENRNFGRLPSFNADAQHQGKCGDVLRLYLDVDGDVIRSASFEHVGCSGLHASAAGLTTLIAGMNLAEARALEVSDIVGYLEGIPYTKLDCAELARDTLRKAIDATRSR